MLYILFGILLSVLLARMAIPRISDHYKTERRNQARKWVLLGGPVCWTASLLIFIKTGDF